MLLPMAMFLHGLTYFMATFLNINRLFKHEINRRDPPHTVTVFMLIRVVLYVVFIYRYIYINVGLVDDIPSRCLGAGTLIRICVD